MPRDISLETAILDILAIQDPAPVQESILLREAEIRLGRLLTTADFQASLATLRELRLVGGSDNVLGLPQAGLTDAGRAARKSR